MEEKIKEAKKRLDALQAKQRSLSKLQSRKEKPFILVDTQPVMMESKFQYKQRNKK